MAAAVGALLGMDGRVTPCLFALQSGFDHLAGRFPALGGIPVDFRIIYGRRGR